MEGMAVFDDPGIFVSFVYLMGLLTIIVWVVRALGL